jgi:hypothetical protein
MKAMLLHRRKPRTTQTEGQTRTRQHRILGIVIDVIDVKARADKKLGLQDTSTQKKGRRSKNVT